MIMLAGIIHKISRVLRQSNLDPKPPPPLTVATLKETLTKSMGGEIVGRGVSPVS